MPLKDFDISNTSPLERCRNAFFSALELNQKGFTAFVLPSWKGGVWTVFLGSDDLARGLLLKESDALLASEIWTFAPSSSIYSTDLSTSSYFANKILNASSDISNIGKVSTIYKEWLEVFSNKVRHESDALPTISFTEGKFEVWLHYRNSDMTSNGKSIERYLISPPLPRLYLENRKRSHDSNTDVGNAGWLNRSASKAVKSAGTADDQSEPNWWRNRQ
jgi:hypothetical protein